MGSCNNSFLRWCKCKVEGGGNNSPTSFCPEWGLGWASIEQQGNGARVCLGALSTWLCSCGAHNAIVLPARSRSCCGLLLLPCLSVYGNFGCSKGGYTKQVKVRSLAMLCSWDTVTSQFWNFLTYKFSGKILHNNPLDLAAKYTGFPLKHR